MDLSGTLNDAGGFGGLLVVKDTVGIYQAGYDATGNLTTLIDSSSGANAASYEYDPFGNLLKSVGPYATNNAFRYITRYTDSETGLVYFGHRYHNPSLGRFISRDPSEESGGINLYSYVRNNPINQNDNLGLYPFRLLFDAFIHKDLGEWRDEPGDYNAQFRTDVRDFGEFDENANDNTGTARVYSIVDVESTKIGKLEKEGVGRRFSAAGMSHRRTRWTRFNSWSKPEAKRAEVDNPDPVIKDVGPCESTVWFKPNAGYPFIRLSPTIDYNIVFKLTRSDKEKKITVSLTGTHDAFPFYESQVHTFKPPFYQYKTPYKGPGPFNLNEDVTIREHTFTLNEQ